MSLNRIVALLTPLVFAPLAGVITTWAAENLPGVTVPPSAVEEIFIAGALIALAPAAQWLHGWQKWEAREAEARTEAARGVGLDGVIAPPVLVETMPEEIEVFEDVADDFGDLEDLDDLDELDDFDEFEDTSVSEDESILTGS